MDEVGPRTIDIDKVSLDDIKKHIKSKHAILWQNWFVTDPKGLEEAARWFKKQLIELYASISGEQSGGDKFRPDIIHE